ncbi:NSP1 protein [Human rotavirus C]|uniref:Non-structural protein 1 n=1 Tax=Human rotavirus C TaxID=10943 RepID=A0A0U3U6B7_9REOV|nr:NSP1 protein [Human rotavirus C]
MANSFREMLYWYRKIIDRKLPCVNVNIWRREIEYKTNGVCLNCLNECKVCPCDYCGIRHKCENCLNSDCFMNTDNEFNSHRWITFDEEPSQMVLFEYWIMYKDYFLSRFNYSYKVQLKILNMNKNRRFHINESKKKALSVPITSQYLKFKFNNKIYIMFGTFLTSKIQPWIQLKSLKIGYIQSLNVDRCAKLIATKGIFAANSFRSSCITEINARRPISECDYLIEACLCNENNEWKFSAVMGRDKIPVTKSLAMKYFCRNINTELFYYGHSKCHVVSECPRWNQQLRVLHTSTLNIIFRRQFMNEVVEWFENFTQLTGMHHDFIKTCVYNKVIVSHFRKEIEDYINSGKKISLSSVIPDGHALYNSIDILRFSLMLAIDVALTRIESQQMDVL